MSEIFTDFFLVQDEKLQLQSIFYGHMSYQENQKNHALNSTVLILGTLHIYCNLKTFKMGKTWPFII
jgi:hypothetical protein